MHFNLKTDDTNGMHGRKIAVEVFVFEVFVVEVEYALLEVVFDVFRCLCKKYSL